VVLSDISVRIDLNFVVACDAVEAEHYYLLSADRYVVGLRPDNWRVDSVAYPEISMKGLKDEALKTRESSHQRRGGVGGGEGLPFFH